MDAENSQAPGGAAAVEIVTAGMLVIGDEILSGRTKDKNIGFLAESLTQVGIELKEVRVVADVEAEIVAALNALRSRYTHVFTTGGIGPTHDDITADAVAVAFGVPLEVNQQAVDLMAARVGAANLNAARLRMARIPAGGTLIENSASAAPGFSIGNVHVMAGVPHIMQAMLLGLLPKLTTGARIHSVSIPARLREGLIAEPLREAQQRFPDVAMGSYPSYGGAEFHTNLVLRSRDEARLAEAAEVVKAMVAALEAAGQG